MVMLRQTLYISRQTGLPGEKWAGPVNFETDRS